MGFVGEGAGVGVRPPRGGELSRFIGSTAWWWTRMLFSVVIPGDWIGVGKGWLLHFFQLLFDIVKKTVLLDECTNANGRAAFVLEIAATSELVLPTACFEGEVDYFDVSQYISLYSIEVS